MKKGKLIHSELSYTVASLGHMDKLVIADSGLPVPGHVKKIDLALTQGVPGFMETLQTVLSECCVEKAWIADEVKVNNPSVHQQISNALAQIPIETVSHAHFKQMVTDNATVVVRTGECTPYANVILQSGVAF